MVFDFFHPHDSIAASSSVPSCFANSLDDWENFHYHAKTFGVKYMINSGLGVNLIATDLFSPNFGCNTYRPVCNASEVGQATSLKQLAGNQMQNFPFGPPIEGCPYGTNHLETRKAFMRTVLAHPQFHFRIPLGQIKIQLLNTTTGTLMWDAIFDLKGQKHLLRLPQPIGGEHPYFHPNFCADREYLKNMANNFKLTITSLEPQRYGDGNDIVAELEFTRFGQNLIDKSYATLPPIRTIQDVVNENIAGLRPQVKALENTLMPAGATTGSFTGAATAPPPDLTGMSGKVENPVTAEAGAAPPNPATAAEAGAAPPNPLGALGAANPLAAITG